MPRVLAAVLAAVFIIFCDFSSASAHVVITVDKTAQRLRVAVDGRSRFDWPVSTARWGYSTPNGTYRPQRLARKWFSRKYDWSPMPYSIFFNGGYAIHGSYEIRRLGRPASHGCIRLHPANAAVLFALVSANSGATDIVVTGVGPAAPQVAQRYRSRSVAGSRQDFEDVFRAPRERPAYYYDDDRDYRRWQRR